MQFPLLQYTTWIIDHHTYIYLWTIRCVDYDIYICIYAELIPYVWFCTAIQRPILQEVGVDSKFLLLTSYERLCDMLSYLNQYINRLIVIQFIVPHRRTNRPSHTHTRMHIHNCLWYIYPYINSVINCTWQCIIFIDTYWTKSGLWRDSIFRHLSIIYNIYISKNTEIQYLTL